VASVNSPGASANQARQIHFAGPVAAKMTEIRPAPKRRRRFEFAGRGGSPRLVIQLQLHDDAARVLALVVNHGASDELIAIWANCGSAGSISNGLLTSKADCPEPKRPSRCATAMMR